MEGKEPSKANIWEDQSLEQGDMATKENSIMPGKFSSGKDFNPLADAWKSYSGGFMPNLGSMMQNMYGSPGYPPITPQSLANNEFKVEGSLPGYQPLATNGGSPYDFTGDTSPPLPPLYGSHNSSADDVTKQTEPTVPSYNSSLAESDSGVTDVQPKAKGESKKKASKAKKGTSMVPLWKGNTNSLSPTPQDNNGVFRTMDAPIVIEPSRSSMPRMAPNVSCGASLSSDADPSLTSSSPQEALSLTPSDSQKKKPKKPSEPRVYRPEVIANLEKIIADVAAGLFEYIPKMESVPDSTPLKPAEGDSMPKCNGETETPKKNKKAKKPASKTIKPNPVNQQATLSSATATTSATAFSGSADTNNLADFTVSSAKVTSSSLPVNEPAKDEARISTPLAQQSAKPKPDLPPNKHNFSDLDSEIMNKVRRLISDSGFQSENKLGHFNGEDDHDVRESNDDDYSSVKNEFTNRLLMEESMLSSYLRANSKVEDKPQPKVEPKFHPTVEPALDAKPLSESNVKKKKKKGSQLERLLEAASDDAKSDSSEPGSEVEESGEAPQDDVTDQQQELVDNELNELNAAEFSAADDDLDTEYLTSNIPLWKDEDIEREKNLHDMEEDSDDPWKESDDDDNDEKKESEEKNSELTEEEDKEETKKSRGRRKKSTPKKRSRGKSDADRDGEEGPKKKKTKSQFERKNIREIKADSALDETTLAAQQEEKERQKRLAEWREKLLAVQKQALEKATQLATPAQLAAKSEIRNGQLKSLLDGNEVTSSAIVGGKSTRLIIVHKKPKPKDEDVVEILSSDDEDKKDGDDDDDMNNCGQHTNDTLNQLDDDGRLLVNVAHPDSDGDIYLAPQLARAVKAHQIGGIRFLYDNLVESTERYKNSAGFGCILAHSMGLGKTLQVISFVDTVLRNTDCKRVLIIVPVNTLQNWIGEFNMWLPLDENIPEEQKEFFIARAFGVSIINDSHKTGAVRTRIVCDWYKKGGVLLIGYEMYRLLTSKRALDAGKPKKKKADDGPEVIDVEEEDKDRETLLTVKDALQDPGPDIVICDEGHRIKNSHAGISQALKKIKTKRRAVLTGYPLQNNLLEYWCMVDFIRPNYLGSKTEFANMFERPIMNGQAVDSTPRDKKLMKARAHVLHELLLGFVQRRGHTVLKMELPPKEEHVLQVRMSELQRKLYRCFMATLEDCNGAWGSQANPLRAFSVCCKIWNHPDVLHKVMTTAKAADDIDLDFDLDGTKKKAGLKKDAKKQNSSSAAAAEKTPLTPPVVQPLSPAYLGPLSSAQTELKIPPLSPPLPCSVASMTPTLVPPAPPLVHQPSFEDGAKIKPMMPELGAKDSFSSQNSNSNQADDAATPQTETPVNKASEGEVSYEWAEEIMKEYTPGVLDMGAKMVIMMSIVEESIKHGDRILLFSQSLFTLNVIEDFLAKTKVPGCAEEDNVFWCKNRNYLRLDGSTSSMERERLITQFNSPENGQLHLFLLSTRAGCLGINLTGANRVIIFDASWNPCHDAQAVCRIYRYGQMKQCFVYRLVTENTMEKKIYERQINKQGMSDRVVDELNPKGHFTSNSKNLLQYSEEEPPAIEAGECVSDLADSVLQRIVSQHAMYLSKNPFAHESLLIDYKEEKLSKWDKKQARLEYERQKRMGAGFSRSYSPYSGSSGNVVMGTRIFRPSAGMIGYRSGMSVVRPAMSTPIPLNALSKNQRFGGINPAALKPGVSVHQIQTTTAIVIPGSNTATDSKGGASKIPAGENVLVIKTPKGVYMRTKEGKIFAVRSQAVSTKKKADDGSSSSSGDVTATSTTVTTSTSESDSPKAVVTTTKATPTKPTIVIVTDPRRNKSRIVSGAKAKAMTPKITVLPKKSLLPPPEPKSDAEPLSSDAEVIEEAPKEPTIYDKDKSQVDSLTSSAASATPGNSAKYDTQLPSYLLPDSETLPQETQLPDYKQPAKSAEPAAVHQSDNRVPDTFLSPALQQQESTAPLSAPANPASPTLMVAVSQPTPGVTASDDDVTIVSEAPSTLPPSLPQSIGSFLPPLSAPTSAPPMTSTTLPPQSSSSYPSYSGYQPPSLAAPSHNPFMPPMQPSGYGSSFSDPLLLNNSPPGGGSSASAYSSSPYSRMGSLYDPAPYSHRPAPQSYQSPSSWMPPPPAAPSPYWNPLHSTPLGPAGGAGSRDPFQSSDPYSNPPSQSSLYGYSAPPPPAAPAPGYSNPYPYSSYGTPPYYQPSYMPPPSAPHPYGMMGVPPRSSLDGSGRPDGF